MREESDDAPKALPVFWNHPAYRSERTQRLAHLSFLELHLGGMSWVWAGRQWRGSQRRL